MMRFRYILIMMVVLAAAMSACKDAWDDHTEIKNPVLAGNLMDLIDSKPELSKFRDLLIKTGYDKVLQSSKSFTVWAPDNSDFDNVLQASGAQSADSLMKNFVAYHVASQAYFTTSTADTTMRIISLKGKPLEFTASTVENAAIKEKDLYTGNGVLHVINHPLIAEKNIWEIFQALPAGSQQDFINSWSVREFDLENSKQIGVNDQGLPVYDSVFTVTNGYIKNVARLDNEQRQYTYFVLEDNLYATEFEKLKPFYNDSTARATMRGAAFGTVKDLAIVGKAYDADHLPAFFYSNDSVKFSVSKGDIVQSYPASNGIVHVLRALHYEMIDKIKPIKVEGENYSQVEPATIALTRRTRRAPDGTILRDIMNNTHTTNGVWVRFSANVYSGRYKVYWRMIRDFSLTPAAGATDIVHFPQKVTWNEPWKLKEGEVFDPLASTGFGYIQESFIKNADNTFAPNYNEVYLGEMSVERQGYINLYLVANRVTTAVQNSLLLDYLRLEPIY